MKYNEDAIQKLDALEHVRLRPGMYFGGTDQRALYNVLYEVLDNALDESISGRCKHVVITLYEGHKVSVEDDSEGIPVHLYKDTGFTFLELLLSAVHGKYSHYSKGFGGLMGLGVCAVNALSEHFIAEVKRDGYLWRQEYRQGKKITEVTQVREQAADEGTGTTITFTPDFTILEPNEFDYETLANRLRELAFLIKGLSLTLRDERTGA